MSTPIFITLPSGLRVNTAHIQGYRPLTDVNKTMLMLDWEDGCGSKVISESMTAEQLDALLNPPSSPIVESVVNLDRFRTGNACSFSYGGDVLHGVIEDIDYSDSLGEPCVKIVSQGQTYTLWPRDGEVNRD